MVFGDIGTSPLYALRRRWRISRTAASPPTEVIGVVSLIVWALIVTVTAKYVLFLMRADNKGEGGILSLMALAQHALGKRTLLVFFLGVAGAALFSGDAIITPAISVLSALEGLEAARSPSLAPYVLPATIVILIAAVPGRRAAARRASPRLFGPIMAVFFLTHRRARRDAYRRCAAHSAARSNPIYGLHFLFGHGVVGFVVLGCVFLAVTGAEALYADMGHFGRRPIQAAWLVLVLPALIAQLSRPGRADPRRSDGGRESRSICMAPHWALLPLVILSTVATVIASQAVITGAFSLARQAIQLGLLPRIEIVHTSETQEGQIYIPRVNRLLLIGVLVLVLLFRSSSALATAYGIAVTGTMVVTTALAFFVVWQLWRWPLWGALALVCRLPVDRPRLLRRQSLKVLDGGWVPLLLGVDACSS